MGCNCLVVTKAGSKKNSNYKKFLENYAEEGDSPVIYNLNSPVVFPSSTSPVEPGANLGGPPPKAKYYQPTDSELVP